MLEAIFLLASTTLSSSMLTIEYYRYPRDAPIVMSHLDTGSSEDSEKARRNGGAQNDELTSPKSTKQLLTLYRTPYHGGFTHQALISRAMSDGKMFKATTFLAMFSDPLSSDPNMPLFAPSLACYTSWLARRDQNPGFVDLSKQYYIRGLRATQRALVDPRRALDDSTLLACHALSLYEALECPDDSMAGYRWHSDGLYRLIRMRGPKAHQDGMAHKLFVVFRLQGVRLRP